MCVLWCKGGWGACANPMTTWPQSRALLEHAPGPVLEQIGLDLQIAYYTRGLPKDSRQLLTECIEEFNRVCEHLR